MCNIDLVFFLGFYLFQDFQLLETKYIDQTAKTFFGSGGVTKKMGTCLVSVNLT